MGSNGLLPKEVEQVIIEYAYANFDVGVIDSLSNTFKYVADKVGVDWKVVGALVLDDIQRDLLDMLATEEE